ncbi:MAG: guanylate kinase [Chitinophagales bacterium]
MQKAIIITAPSGAGKTTLVRMLLEKRDDLSFSISACTREKRHYEEHGKDYYFLSIDDFRQKVANDEFVEWEEVYQDMCYGTLRSEVERIWSDGKSVIFDIDVKGAVNVKKYLGDKALVVFIKPPTQEELKKRLIGRGTESEATLQKRYNRSLEELAYEPKFDTVVVNDDLEEAFIALQAKVDAFLRS